MKLKITVHGVAYEVDVEVLDPGEGFPVQSQPPLPRVHNRFSETDKGPSLKNDSPVPHLQGDRKLPLVDHSDGAVSSPIAGTVLAIKCKVGDRVKQDEVLLVIEAMKMETSIAAPFSGVINQIHVAVGDSVRESQQLITLSK